MIRRANWGACAAGLIALAGCSTLLGIGNPEYALVDAGGDGTDGPLSADDAGTDAPDADALAPIPCPAKPQTNVVYVDPVRGASTAAGTCQAPLRTITAAIAVVENAPATFDTIALQPGTYATETNGEAFPLVLPRAVTLQGSSASAVTIRGGRLDSGISDCAVSVPKDLVTLRDVTITGKGGAQGVCVAGAGENILRVSAIESDGHGLMVTGGKVDVQDSTFAYNAGYGLLAQGSAVLTLTNMEASHNARDGLSLFNTAQVTSTGSRFSLNGTGVACRNDSQLTSTNDRFSANTQVGLSIGDATGGLLAVTLTGATFDANLGSGVDVVYGKVTARDSAFTNNGLHGVRLANFPSAGIDLGKTGSAGNNHFAGNTGAGVCLDWMGTGLPPSIEVSGNHFPVCPATQSGVSCSKFDLGRLSSQGAIVPPGPACSAP